jgi:hypothetical protein
MSAYEELSGHHLHSTLNLVASTPASKYLDSTKTPETELRATASRHYDPRDARPHMHPLYYYFGAPDSDSADDTYDPTRECFNIDGAIVLDLEDETAVEGRNTPPQVELPAERDEAQFLADQGMQLEQIRELQDRLDEERENLRLLQQTFVTCPSHRTPRPVEPGMKSEDSSRPLPCSRPRVLPPGDAGLPRSNLRSPPVRRERPQFIPNTPNGTRRSLSVNASSTTVNLKMPMTASSSAGGANMVTVQLEATTSIEEDALDQLEEVRDVAMLHSARY